MVKGKYGKYKNRFEKFLASENGKRAFNFAYSWGAAIVVAGALFKLLYLPGANFMLSLGMGIEVVMFFISAFDYPSKDYRWEEVFPVLKSGDEADRPAFAGGGGSVAGNGSITMGDGNIDLSGLANLAASAGNGGGGVMGGGTVVIGDLSGGMPMNPNISAPVQPIGGGMVSGAPMIIGTPMVSPSAAKEAVGLSGVLDLSETDTQNLSESIKRLSAVTEQLSKMAELGNSTQQYLSQLDSLSDNMKGFSEATSALTNVSNALLSSYQSVSGEQGGVIDHSRGYVNQMESLNRNLSGLNTIYEIQLKSISSQINTIDQINHGLNKIKDMYDNTSTDYCEESEKMTQLMAALNAVYYRMLDAMNMNMAGRPPMPPNM